VVSCDQTVSAEIPLITGRQVGYNCIMQPLLMALMFAPVVATLILIIVALVRLLHRFFAHLPYRLSLVTSGTEVAVPASVAALLSPPATWTSQKHFFWKRLRLLVPAAALLAAALVVTVSWNSKHGFSWWISLTVAPLALASMVNRIERVRKVSKNTVYVSQVDGSVKQVLKIYNSLARYMIRLAGLAISGTVFLLMFGSLGKGAIGWWLPTELIAFICPLGYVVAQLKGGLPVGWLALTPQYITYVYQGGSPVVDVSWDDVVEIRAESDRGDPNIRVIPRHGEDVTLVSTLLRKSYEEMGLLAAHPDAGILHSPKATVCVRARYFREPVIVLYVLRYYHEHPDKRDELGDDSSARRISSGQLQ
jgi:hypothetical protein